MKQRIVLGLAVASLTGAISVVARGATDADSDPEPCTDRCYWVEDRRVELDVQGGRFAVRGSAYSADEILATIDNQGFEGVTLDESLSPRTHLFLFESASGSATVDATLELIDSVSEVLLDGLISPVFSRPIGGPPYFLLQDDFYVYYGRNGTAPDEVPVEIAGIVSEEERNAHDIRGLLLYRTEITSGLELMRTINAFAESRAPVFAHPNFLGFGIGPDNYYPSDPYFGHTGSFPGPQWGLNHVSGQWPGEPQTDLDINAPEAWDSQFGLQHVWVIVLDTGVQRDWFQPGEEPEACAAASPNDHPDIVPGGTDIWIDFLPAEFSDLCIGAPANDCDNHGTAVAGVIRAAMNNSSGGAGVASGPNGGTPGVRLGSVRVFGDPVPPCTSGGYVYNATAFNDAIARARDHANSNNLRVVTNLSANGYADNGAIDASYRESRDLDGFVHFVSAGNTIPPQHFPCLIVQRFPARLPYVNAVTALDHAGSSPQLYQSCTGPEADLTAPGHQIVTTDRTGPKGFCTAASGDCLSADYYRASGTSFASPLAASVAAMVLSASPSLTSQAVEFVLRTTAKDLGSVGHDSSFGWGIPRADAALALAADLIFFDGFETNSIDCWSDQVGGSGPPAGCI